MPASISRRSILAGLIAMPAIVRYGSLMPVKSSLQNITQYRGGPLTSVDVLYGQVIFKNNKFLTTIENDYYIGGVPVHVIGSQLRIKMPHDYAAN